VLHREISVNQDCRFVGDRYELLGLLATGGMGQVWRARDLGLDRPVAVKVLRPRYAADTAAMTRFRSEARLSARLTHANIATVHDYGETRLTPGPYADRVAFLVMELVDGGPLSAVLRREGRLPASHTLEIVRQTAAGLAAAHAAGVVHRDVKPSNLLLGSDGIVKITDFGIAWSSSNDRLTGTGEVMGTAQYLSPERALGDPAGPASDIYALGMVAYECLAGRRPFDGASPVQVARMQVNRPPDPLPEDVPEGVRRLVTRMLAKDPEERFADGAALLTAVEDLMAWSAESAEPDQAETTVLAVATPQTGPAHLSAPASAASPRARHAAHSSRQSGRLLMALVAVLALVAVVAVVLAGIDRPPSPVAGHTATPTTAATIRIAAENYLGRPVGEVEASLTDLGVSVQLQSLQTAEAPDGAVLAVDPAGAVYQGQAVTVSYAIAPPAPSPGAEQGGAAVPGADTQTPDPGDASTQPSTAPETSAGPGNSGHASSNGRGNGRGKD
jgi:eukaryotic-like serine/threonine-protein kinase